MTTKSEEGGVLLVTACEAKNLAAMDKGGTSDPYCVIKTTFNRQTFKTAVSKKTTNPLWNQEFKFYTSEPSGHVIIRVWDKDRWSSDDFLGEIAIPLKGLKNGKTIEEWYVLTNEPKKTKDKTPNKPPGEVKIKLHFPLPGSSNNNQNVSELKHSPSTDKVSTKTQNGEFLQNYSVGRELGRGGFSIVKEVKNIASGEKFAVKIIEKTTAEEELNLLKREIDIMSILKHQNIIQLIEVFDEDDYIYLILELVTGGELFDQIVSRGSYGEGDAANIVKQILEAVYYMHSNGIAHRDLKPENLLCSGEGGDVIKVTDFGLSKDFGSASLQTSCGTPDYVAPEVLLGRPYDNSVDIWSIGVITYILLCGFPPFYGNSDREIFEKILKADFDFPTDGWEGVSEEAKDFICKILVLDPSKRPTAQDCLKHPWLVGNLSNLSLLTKGKLEVYNKKRGKKTK